MKVGAVVMCIILCTPCDFEWRYIGITNSLWAFCNFIPLWHILTIVLASLSASSKLSQFLHMHMFGKHCQYTTASVAVLLFVGIYHCFPPIINIVECRHKKHAYQFCMGNWLYINSNKHGDAKFWGKSKRLCGRKLDFWVLYRPCLLFFRPKILHHQRRSQASTLLVWVHVTRTQTIVLWNWRKYHVGWTISHIWTITSPSLGRL